jgi:hypothetical protein
MIHVALANIESQVIKGMVLEAPANSIAYDAQDRPVLIESGCVFKVTHNNRIGVNRYRINLQDIESGKLMYQMNYGIGKNKKGNPVWSRRKDLENPEDIPLCYSLKTKNPLFRKVPGEKRYIFTKLDTPIRF